MTDLQDHILVVDDEYIIAAGLCAQIARIGMKVCGIAGTANKAIALAQKHRPSIILMDMRLRGQRDGVDAAITDRDVPELKHCDAPVPASRCAPCEGGCGR